MIIMSSWNNLKPHFRDKGALPFLPKPIAEPVFQPTFKPLEPLKPLPPVKPVQDYSPPPLNVAEFCIKPIRYLEIGTQQGLNLLTVAGSYAAHPGSQVHCIGEWKDFDSHFQENGHQSSSFDIFLEMVELSEHKHKIMIHRGASFKMIPTLEDESFDIIYISGTYDANQVLEEAVLSFRKLKKGGVLIFDNYTKSEYVQKGIDGFLISYYKQIMPMGVRGGQMTIRKK